ncbi:hypothetical protein ABFA07_002387 [Porites harrisoni]
MASSATRGRGIGRGRGFGVPKTQSKPGETTYVQQNSSQSKSTQEIDLKRLLSDLKEESLDDKVDKLSSYICSSDSAGDHSASKITQVVDSLIQRSMKDSEFSPLAAKVANKLCSDETNGNTFRSALLKATQENYKNRESIRRKSVSEWMGLVSLICELFNHLRTGGLPLKPLAGAVYQTLVELLRVEEAIVSQNKDEEEDEIDCFYLNFKTVGKLLKSVDQAKFDDLVGGIRDTILADNTTGKTRCLLLELLELYARDWNISTDLERYYCDMLADIMAKDT